MADVRRLGVGVLAVVGGSVAVVAFLLVYQLLLPAALAAMVVVAGVGLLLDRPVAVASGFAGVTVLALLLTVIEVFTNGPTPLAGATLVLAVAAGYRGGQYARAAGIA